MLKHLPALKKSAARLSIGAGLALFLLLLAGPAGARGVTLIKSGGLPVYAELHRGVLARLERSAARVAGKQLTTALPSTIDLSNETPTSGQLKSVDVLVAIGAKAHEAAVGSGVPVVSLLVNAPLDSAGALGNVTGVRMTFPPSAWARVTQEAFPGRRRVGLLHSPALAGWVEEAQHALGHLGLTLVARKVESGRDVAAGLKDLAAQTDVYWMLPDILLVNPETVESLSLFSLENRIPIITFSEKFLKTGATAALLPDLDRMAELAARLVEQILENQGKRPLPEPLDPPGALRWNKTIAEKLGIAIAATPERGKQ